MKQTFDSTEQIKKMLELSTIYRKPSEPGYVRQLKSMISICLEYYQMPIDKRNKILETERITTAWVKKRIDEENMIPEIESMGDANPRLMFSKALDSLVFKMQSK